jgi:hypothetical protein
LKRHNIENIVKYLKAVLRIEALLFLRSHPMLKNSGVRDRTRGVSFQLFNKVSLKQIYFV